MAMRVQNIRFSDRQWELICDMAKRSGVPTAAYVREAALLRAAFQWAREPDSKLIETQAARDEIRDVLRNHGLM